MKTIPIGVPDNIHYKLRIIAAKRGVRMQDIFIEAVTLTNPIDMTVEERAMRMVAGGMPDAVVSVLVDRTVSTIKAWRKRHELPANRLDRAEWAHVLEPSKGAHK